MRKSILLLICISLLALQAISQIPDKFNYQGVLRNASGEVVKNTSIRVKISLLKGSTSGTLIYSENHTVSTNNFGQFGIQIGGGTVVSGTYNTIDWSQQLYQKTEVANPSGGTLVDMGTTQLISVPYSIYSGKAKVLDNNLLYFTDTDTLFAVKDRDGNIVFAVFPDGAKVYVNNLTKGKVGGFAVSGRTPTKLGTEVEYLHVTPDSTRIYVNDSSLLKGKVGGFAVSGRTPTKGVINDYLFVTADSTRIFTNDSIGGFSVKDNSNGNSSSYLNLTPLNYSIGHESGELIIQDTNASPGFEFIGKYNTFLGYNAGKNTRYGHRNIFLGHRAGYSNTDGGQNIYIGNSAGETCFNGAFNIFIGDNAGKNLYNGLDDLFIGTNSGLEANSDANRNVFLGNNTGRSNVSGDDNVYVGLSAGYFSDGSENTFVGKETGRNNLGSYNTYIGAESGAYNESASNNVYIGYRAGVRSTGTGNVIIGYRANDTGTATSTFNNTIAIGDSVILTENNQIRIGNSNATSLYCTGAYNSTASGGVALYINSDGKIGTITSSKRYKKDISPLEINTSDIYKLRPVSYTSLSDNKRYFGLIAEDVAKIIPELAEFAKAKDVVPGSDSEELMPNAVHYPFLSVLLLKEIQKHESTIDIQDMEIQNLKKVNEDLNKRLETLEKLLLK